MEILVCVKRVPDASENEIALNSAGKDIERDDLVYSVNEWDNYAVEEAFSPEFRNRLDAVVTFSNLDDEIMRLIVRKEIKEFAVQLEEKHVTLDVTDKAVAWLADKGFSALYGAREVARLFQDKVKNFFVDAVLFGDLKPGGRATVKVKKDNIVIECQTGEASPSSHARI